MIATHVSAEVQLLPDHAGGRLDGIKIIQFSNHVLTLASARAASGFLVARSDQPLRLGSVVGATARLQPGWDGTLGYSLYGLQVTIATPGHAIIQLESPPPPQTPVATMEAETDWFVNQFHSRGSRFPDDPAAFAVWQRQYRQNLTGWLMGGGVPARLPLEAKIVTREDRPRFTLQRVEYRSRADRTNILLLALPKTAPRAPLLLALHGHEGPWGDADPKAFQPGHADDFCGYFAERGWAVLQPATMNHTLQRRGWTLQGEWTWDALTALDYAATRDTVDMNRVAVCGLSTGGHLAMNALALDDRIKAGVVGCVLSTWHHYAQRFRMPPHCDCGITTQLGTKLEGCDWAALAAPKPVQFQHGRKDASFCPGADPTLLNLKWNTGVMPAAEYEVMFAEVKRAYSLTQSLASVVTTIHDAEHRVDNEAAFQWLDSRLGRDTAPTRGRNGKTGENWRARASR